MSVLFALLDRGLVGFCLALVGWDCLLMYVFWLSPNSLFPPFALMLGDIKFE
jgi:hypothetical protein